MSIVSVNETFPARSGAWTADGGRRYTRVFRVQCDYLGDGPNTAIQACGVNLGDQYIIEANFETDLYAYCTSLSSVQDEGDMLWWVVTVEYGPYSALWAGGGPTQNPLLQPIDVEWSTRDQEIVADCDLNGAQIVNTAGDPYDPPIVEDDPRPVMTVTRNEPTVNLGLMVAYRNAVNSDTFAGFDPLFSRCLTIAPKSIFHQFVGWYYQVRYEFEFLTPQSANLGNNGYRRTVLNQGLRAKSVVSGEPYHITLKGIPITEPVLLDSKGVYPPSGPVPYYNVYQTKAELPFAVFNFDPLAVSGLRSGFNTGYGPPG